MILQVVNDTMQVVINEVVNTGLAIHELTGGSQIINGIDNTVTGSVISLILAAVIRFFERRHLKRKLTKND